MMPRHKRRPPVRRRRYRLNPKVLPTLLLTLVAVGMVIMVVNLLRPDSSISAFSQPTAAPTEAPTPEATLAPAEPTAEPTPAPTEKTVNEARIRAIGDVMVHDDELASALQSDGTYDFAPFFSEVAQSLSDADYTMGNLETTVGEPGKNGYSGYPYFHTPKSLLTALKGAGVDMLTTSNNHCLDRYFDGLVETLDSLDEAGFDHTGTFRSKSEYQTPYVTEVNGIKIGVVAYTYGANGMDERSDPDGVMWGLMFLDNANFEKSAQKLRDAGAEVLIAVPHWGKEYKRAPENSTVDYAKKMAKAGFDVIIGGHPHMVQPIEWIETERADGTTHRTLVAYSLGNFVSAQTDQYKDTGIILDFTIHQEISTGEISITNVGYVPVWVWRYEGSGKNEYRVLPCGAAMDDVPEGISDASKRRLSEAWSETLELMTADGITALRQ